jgi:hypothetical protein
MLLPRLYVRSFGIAKFRPFHLKSTVSFKGSLSHFRTNMLPFAIAVSPDEKSFCISGLLRNICSYAFFILSYSKL